MELMDKEQTLKYITEHQLVSFMNNTKWKELFSEINADENFLPKVNIKFIDDESNDGKFAPIWHFELEAYGFNQIEWLEINPIKEEWVGALVSPKTRDYSEFIKSALEKNNVPFEIINRSFRIIGYLRPQPLKEN